MMKPHSNPAIFSDCGQKFHSAPVTKYRCISGTSGTFVLLTHAKPYVNYVHEHGNPHAGMGSPARRLSGADGRRLRSRRRAVSILTGAPSHSRSAYLLGLDLSLPGAR